MSAVRVLVANNHALARAMRAASRWIKPDRLYALIARESRPAGLPPSLAAPLSSPSSDGPEQVGTVTAARP